MRNRLLNYLGYGLGAFLVTHKDPPPAHLAGKDQPMAPPPPTWLKRDESAAKPDKRAAAPSTSPLSLVKSTWNGFSDDDCMTLGAAMAYYTVFSLAPLLLMVVSIAGLVFGREAIQHQISGQIQSLIGSGAADQVSSMLAKQAQNTSGGVIGTVIGMI